MVFNVGKCKVMHIGHNHNKAVYKMNEVILEEVIQERDLGVIIQNDLRCSKQCLKAFKT